MADDAGSAGSTETRTLTRPTGVLDDLPLDVADLGQPTDAPQPGAQRSDPAARDFLTLPRRTRKPRRTGLTHVLDSGLSAADLRAVVANSAELIDVWKFGWGSAYIDPELDEKLAVLAEAGIRSCTGGTFLELAWLQGVEARFFDWAAAVGFTCIEVSRGTVDMPRSEKTRLIQTAAERFRVVSEVGSKDPDVPIVCRDWTDAATADLEAGAAIVITEGRESGTVGFFSPDGRVRNRLAESMIAEVGLDRLLFEAPQKSQQAYLIQRYGANVNLGNIAPRTVLSVESLRLGLRSDTMAVYTQGDDGPTHDHDEGSLR